MVLNLGNKGYHRTNRFLLRWKLWAIITFPVILSPVTIIPWYTQESRCAYLLGIMMVFWVLDLIPLPVTSLLPVTLVPLLGIASSDFITPAYTKEINMLLIGCITVATAVEYCGLHRRIALKILIMLGTAPRWLMLGFMLPTVFLSMWINNTSTTALMAPIADTVLAEMFPWDSADEPEPGEAPREVPDDPELIKKARNMRQGIMLCIAHSSLLGGTMTLTGTGTNLVLMATVDAEYSEDEIKMNYLTWMLFNMPNGVVCLFFAWFVLQICFMGWRATFSRQKETTETEIQLKEIIKKKYLDLGPMTYHEKTVLTLFIILILLWMSRDPGFMKGWVVFFTPGIKIKDSSTATIIVVLLFTLSATADWWWSDLGDRSLDPPPPKCLTWKVVHARFSWGVFLLMGGGFAIAGACKVSGLSAWVGRAMMVLEGVPTIILIILVTSIAVSVTSCTSNTATATILLPVLVSVAEGTKIPPLLLMIPATIGCSLAFLFPVSTPPNAIIFDRAKISIPKMALVGLFQTVVCLSICIISLYIYAPLIFNMAEHPHFKNKP